MTKARVFREPYIGVHLPKGTLSAPSPQRRRQIQLARHRTDRLALVQDQADGTFLELLRELPTGPSATTASGHAGHRIHLSERVHRSGSAQTQTCSANDATVGSSS